MNIPYLLHVECLQVAEHNQNGLLDTSRTMVEKVLQLPFHSAPIEATYF